MKQLRRTNDVYRLSKTSYLDIAQAIDFINKYTIECYCGYTDKNANPDDIHTFLYKKNPNINSVVFQFAIDIMTHKGFIDSESIDGEPNSIKNFLYTKKGINLFFKGGMKKDIIKKRRQKWLMITGQISIILAGVYYLFELLAIIFPTLFC